MTASPYPRLRRNLLLRPCCRLCKSHLRQGVFYVGCVRYVECALLLCVECVFVFSMQDVFSM